MQAEICSSISIYRYLLVTLLILQMTQSPWM